LNAAAALESRAPNQFSEMLGGDLEPARLPLCQTGRIASDCPMVNSNSLKTFLLAALTSVALMAQAADPTALQLVKEGNKHVGQDAKDRLVQIRSEKSVGTLIPNIWYIVYYDPDATAKATEVKFGAGQKLDVKRPGRILEFVTGNRELDRSKINVDSDKALTTALQEPMLKNLTLTSSQMWLENNKDYGIVWKVRLWATKLRNAQQTAEIGDLYISADTGKLVRNDLKISRVD